MKVIFVGPSLPDATLVAGPNLVIRPPACQGDIMQAVSEGATTIGLIDGLFEFVAPVWHKELLYALSQGISVLGAASMGALRAAECAAFGMQGVGQIFDAYRNGHRIDDADVALLHGPAELNYPAITIPLVNVDATLSQAVATGLLPDEDAEKLGRAARSLFFKDRTWNRVAGIAGLDPAQIGKIVKTAAVDQKRLDAIALVEAVRSGEPVRQIPHDWQFNATPLWRQMYP